MNIKSMTLPEMQAALKELGQPAFRAKQVYTWLHKGVRSYDEMTNLSKDLRRSSRSNTPSTPPRSCASRSPKRTAPSSTSGSLRTATVWKRCT